MKERTKDYLWAAAWFLAFLLAVYAADIYDFMVKP